MDNFKRFTTFSRGERIAVVAIVSVIVTILIVRYIIINNPPKRDYFKHDLDSIIARRESALDSLRRADSAVKAQVSFRANLDRREREAGKSSINEYNVYRKKRHDTARKAFSRSAPVEMTTIDINTADTTLLKQLPGIGSSFAKWIVNYREKLGGYCETVQLLEVYRMDTMRFNELKGFVKIDSAFQPNKLKINTDAFKILLKHPYLEYEDVKKIINQREQKGMIVSWEHLMKVVGDTVNPRLRYYVDYQ